MPVIAWPVASSTIAVKTDVDVEVEGICGRLTDNCIVAAVLVPVGAGGVVVELLLGLPVQPATNASAVAIKNVAENLVIF